MENQKKMVTINKLLPLISNIELDSINGKNIL
jgi:hypothetical protein